MGSTLLSVRTAPPLYGKLRAIAKFTRPLPPLSLSLALIFVPRPKTKTNTVVRDCPSFLPSFFPLSLEAIFSRRRSTKATAEGMGHSLVQHGIIISSCCRVSSPCLSGFDAKKEATPAEFVTYYNSQRMDGWVGRCKKEQTRLCLDGRETRIYSFFSVVVVVAAAVFRSNR